MAKKKKTAKSKSTKKAASKKTKSSKNVQGNKQLTVSALENGTVIDHIPAFETFRVAEILKLGSYDDTISVATNLSSKELGKKGLVKVAGRYLTDHEVNKIAIIAPNATVNIIKNYAVIEKVRVSLPEIIDRVIKCSNPVCITNHEQTSSRFHILKSKNMRVRCHYCEKEMSHEEITLI